MFQEPARAHRNPVGTQQHRLPPRSIHADIPMNHRTRFRRSGRPCGWHQYTAGGVNGASRGGCCLSRFCQESGRWQNGQARANVATGNAGAVCGTTREADQRLDGRRRIGEGRGWRLPSGGSVTHEGARYQAVVGPRSRRRRGVPVRVHNARRDFHDLPFGRQRRPGARSQPNRLPDYLRCPAVCWEFFLGRPWLMSAIDEIYHHGERR